VNIFTLRPGAILPDERQVIATISHGAAGRDLASAVFASDVRDIRRLLGRDPTLINAMVSEHAGDPLSGPLSDLLTCAVSTGRLATITALLESGMPPDGMVPGLALSLALLADTPDMAALLLASGAAPDPQCLIGGTDAMAIAIEYDHPGAVSMLLRHGADPRWADGFGIDRVRLAVDSHRFAIAEQIIDGGGCGWRIAADGSTAAHGVMSPPVWFDQGASGAARARLAIRFARDAEAVSLPWPLPPPATIRAALLAGRMPTDAMRRIGMIALPGALARIVASDPVNRRQA
jgi:hypothetical protein